MRLRALGALTLAVAVTSSIAPLTAAQAATATPHDVGTASTEFYLAHGNDASIGGGTVIDNTSPSVSVSSDLKTVTANIQGWELSLSSSAPLAPGTYTSGVSITVTMGTSYNCATGSFTIIEMSATDVNATFSLDCGPSASVPDSVGFLRYNATVDTPVPTTPNAAQAITDPPNSGTTSANADEFSFNSAPGDYIGVGSSVDFTGANLVVGGTQGTATVGAGTWTLDLSAPAGGLLVPGTYTGATGYPFNSGTAPGISLYGDGRGCDQYYGTFTIYQIASDATGALSQLNATFTQTCEKTTAPPLVGFIRYNATEPTPIPAFLTASASPVAGASLADGSTNVTLTAKSNATAGASYSYNFGDGAAATVSASSSATKAEYEGTYPVSVTVTDAGQITTSATGYFTVGDGYHAVTPQRLLDTRYGTGGTKGPVAKNGKVTITLPTSITNSGHGTLSAVVINLTVTQPTALGLVTAYSTGLSQNPTTSNLNYSKGETIANLVTVPILPGGKIVLSVSSGGTEQLIADLEGYYTAGNDPTNAGYGSVTPTRILDTRHDTGGAGGRVAGGKTIKLKLPSSVPTGATAIVLNVTAVAPSKAGVISVFPDGTTPNASNLNFPASENLPNLVIVAVPADRTIDFKNGGSGAVDILGDLDGYFSDSATSKFVPYYPTRLFDTRKYGGALDPFYYESYTMAYALQVPVAALTASLYNVTVTAPTASGYVSVVPDPIKNLPSVSNLNFSKGQTIANGVLAPMTNGVQDYLNGSPSGSIQLISDFFGYFAKPLATTAPPSSPNAKPSANVKSPLAGNAVAAPTARLGGSAFAR
ncbi:PKD domain-containing protein [Actinospica durhamensis]|uniref:PKD domain-containing protein n=1 Tax=Actinospica durhamensis TaxID=1508375 RepID=A0A941IQX0_9ACTN|nr:PKD domain-containing protein [Actinospica durhamensis]MBR7831716.1 PKD domain-containing protein [Actinospica durhamensis]